MARLVDAALTNPAAAGSGPPPALGSGGTVGAPPLAAPSAIHHAPAHHAHHEPAHPAHAQPSYEPTRPPPKKGGSGLVIALAIVALLLGAGAVVAYVVGTQESTPVPMPPPTFATETPSTPTAPVTTPATTVTPVTPLTTVTVTTPTPGPGPTPTPTPKKDAGGGGQAQQDAGGGGGGQPAADAGGASGQTTIVTPFGTFQFPGPRPPFYPPDQPWPPPNIGPLPSPAP
ncbi:MAG: hypothetical protein KF764_16250 [Labilithrix sp.]|nr:hypothetical protein [Labilithrix sp.]